MIKKKTINLELTPDEANIVMEALGNLPYVKVFQLINKIQQCAHEQFNGQNANLEKVEPNGSE